ncbi:MAG: hypothetical protein JWM96_737 [Alphaproteobacteria bacterium]|nr:hypothetical protein [Alphaproteobacteria bacterium]
MRFTPSFLKALLLGFFVWRRCKSGKVKGYDFFSLSLEGRGNFYLISPGTFTTASNKPSLRMLSAKASYSTGLVT